VRKCGAGKFCDRVSSAEKVGSCEKEAIDIRSTEMLFEEGDGAIPGKVRCLLVITGVESL
jgi:hypothetical protein